MDATHHDISAFFTSPTDAERALDMLVETGVPRDLIEVAVSPEANRKHVGGRARRLGSQVARFAGIGALIGLLVGIVFSLEIILAFPGFEPPARELSIAQLLGPNVAMMIGAIIGASVGWFVRRPLEGPLSRVKERDEILVVVRAQPASSDEAIQQALGNATGHDIVVAPAYKRPKRRWFS